MKTSNIFYLLIAVALALASLPGCVAHDPDGNAYLKAPLGQLDTVTGKVTPVLLSGSDIQSAISAGIAVANAKTPEEKQSSQMNLTSVLIGLLGLATGGLPAVHKYGKDSGWVEAKGAPAVPPSI